MLTLHVEKIELFNPITSEVSYTEEKDVQMEHSLVSLQMWEAKYHTSFLNKKEKTQAEMLDYIRCMVIGDIDDITLNYICSSKNYIKEITDYINDPMTATTISENGNKRSREIITAEIIYYWMTELNIPQEYRFWHLNQLMMLIQVCAIKRQPPKKMSRSEAARSNHALNKARKQKLKTTG